MSAAFKATEGNGGAPVVVGREPVEVPDIPRGHMKVGRHASLRGVSDLGEGAKLSFSLSMYPNGNHIFITYHDIDVISIMPDGRASVFVGPHDVVTWEKISVAS